MFILCISERFATFDGQCSGHVVADKHVDVLASLAEPTVSSFHTVCNIALSRSASDMHLIASICTVLYCKDQINSIDIGFLSQGQSLQRASRQFGGRT